EDRNAALQKATRAEKALQALDRRRQEEAAARGKAEEAARLADESRQEALRLHEQSLARLASLYAGAGKRFQDRHDLFEALPWSSEALRLAQGDSRREQALRMRLAAILAQSPRPVQAWFHDQPVGHARFSPDGRRVLTAAADGTAHVWDAATGQPVGAAM